MIKEISEKITQKAVEDGNIKSEQYEEYLYGINMILNIFITDITMIIIGIIMRMLWECIAFWFFYKILRKYCGGYHFSTSLKCYLSSCVMCPVILAAVKYIPFNMFIWAVITFIGCIILFILSPVEAVNKPLDEKEISVFGRIARFLVVIILIIFIIAVLLKWIIISKIISVCIISVAVFSIAGKIAVKKARMK